MVPRQGQTKVVARGALWDIRGNRVSNRQKGRMGGKRGTVGEQAEACPVSVVSWGLCHEEAMGKNWEMKPEKLVWSRSGCSRNARVER